MQKNDRAPQKKKRSRVTMFISSGVLLALIAVTLLVVFKDNSPAEILEALRATNPWWIGAALVMMALYFLMQGFTFAIPTKRLGIRVKFRDHIGFALTGFYFSGITPSATGGQPMQLYAMMRRGVSTADASLVLLITNIAFQAAVMLLGLLLLGLRFMFVSATVAAMQVLIIAGYLIAAALLAGLLFITFSKTAADRFVHWVVRLLTRMKLLKHPEETLQKAEAQIAEYKRGAAVLRQQKGLIWSVLGVTLLQMIFYFAVPYFIYLAFGLSGQNILDLLALQAVLYMAVSYLPLPGAVGVSERGFVLMFSMFFSDGLIVPAMLLSRGITFYLPLIVSGIAVLLIQLIQKPKKSRLKARAVCRAGDLGEEA